MGVMTEEFKKARDEANNKLYDIEQHDLWTFEKGADWAYEWVMENVYEPTSNDRHVLDEANIRLNQKLAIAVEALERMEKGPGNPEALTIEMKVVDESYRKECREALSKIKAEF